VKIYPKHLVPLAAIVCLLSMSLTIAFRSIQANAGNAPEPTLTNGYDSGQFNDRGRLRTYEIYTPSSYNPSHPMPLVLVFHGDDGSGRSIADVTRFNELAQKAGFIAVYPNGIDSSWNLRGSHRSALTNIDDVSFVSALLDRIEQTRSIDTQRIYATGFSRGAILVQDLACELPDRIAAFASVAGSLPYRIQPQCQPNTPISMLMINGTNDLAVHYQGDVKEQHGALIPIPDAIDFWRSHDQCTSSDRVKELPDPAPSDRFKVKVSRYSGCRDGSEIMLMAVVDGGHLWPGGASQDASINQFNAQLGFNATETIWNFFQRHSLSVHTLQH
jgi:polyhydroxybutyrate depolymerase